MCSICAKCVRTRIFSIIINAEKTWHFLEDFVRWMLDVLKIELINEFSERIVKSGIHLPFSVSNIKRKTENFSHFVVHAKQINENIMLSIFAHWCVWRVNKVNVARFTWNKDCSKFQIFFIPNLWEMFGRVHRMVNFAFIISFICSGTLWFIDFCTHFPSFQIKTSNSIDN